MTLRHFGIALLAAAALLPLAGSCTKIEMAEADSRVALDYSVALEKPYSLEQPQTKTPLTKAATAYDTNDKFKSYAWYLPNGKRWDNDKADAQAYFENVTVEFQTDKWRGADQRYYWPKEGSLSFWSYSPASLATKGNINVTKDGVTLTGWTVDASTNQDIDFMVADFVSDRTTNVKTYGYQGVPTLFRHKLAKVTVNVSTASARSTTNDIKLYKVSFKNVYTTGSFTMTQPTQDTKATESWIDRSTLQEIVIYENTNGLELDLDAVNVTLNGKDLLAVPQVLNADTNRGTGNPVKLCLEYSMNSTDHATAERSLPGIKSQLWGIGQHITYSVVFGEENEPIEFSGSVGDWETGQSSDVYIGTE
jgi:type II secretory pathway pseudopilin PulG